MSKFFSGVVACLMTGAAAVAAWGAPVQWPGNGHYYDVVAAPAGISWPGASAAAQASTFNAAAGDLATLTSSDENTFVFGLVNDPALWVAVGTGSRGPWIGGFQPAGSVEPAGGWQWVGGEPFVFSNWAAGEPNNGPGEDRIHFYNGTIGGGGAPIPAASWNDLDSANATPRAYVVEYVPDPAGAGVASAMIIAAWTSRRRTVKTRSAAAEAARSYNGDGRTTGTESGRTTGTESVLRSSYNRFTFRSYTTATESALRFELATTRDTSATGCDSRADALGDHAGPSAAHGRASSSRG